MKSIVFGQYYPAESVLHRLDPRIKILITVLYIVSTFLCKNVFSFGLLLLSAVVLVLLGKVPPRAVFRSLRPVLFVLAFTAFLNVFWTKGEGDPIFSKWIISIYKDGIYNAVFIMVRIVALILGTSMLLTYTTTPIALTDAIEDLLSPLKKLHLPVHEFAMMMTIALRFIPTLIEETEKIMTAQKARGADFTSGNIVQRAKSLIPVLIPLFVSAFNRATELATAMECRCYHGGEGRTRMNVRRVRFTDVAYLVIFVLFCAALVGLNILNIGYTMG